MAIEADVTSLRGAVGVLLGFGSWIRVVSPPELRELMAGIAREVLADLEPTSDP